MNDKAVCRTAPATPGLSIKVITALSINAFYNILAGVFDFNMTYKWGAPYQEGKYAQLMC